MDARRAYHRDRCRPVARSAGVLVSVLPEGGGRGEGLQSESTCPRMTGLFEWLLKLLFIVMLAPFFVCFFGQLVVGVAVVLLPWLIGFFALIALAAGIGAGLVVRRRL